MSEYKTYYFIHGVTHEACTVKSPREYIRLCQLTQYVTGEINFDEMFRLLNTAIHQFAKRQMTWFRKLEREGVRINWIDGALSMEEKVSIAMVFI